MGNQLFLFILSLSISGALLGLLLFAIRPLTRKYFSKKWHYYLWMIVIIRLILPFSTETNLIGILFSNQASKVNTAQQTSFTPIAAEDSQLVILQDIAPLSENSNAEKEDLPVIDPLRKKQSSPPDFFSYLWVIWLFGAVLLLVIKIVDYRNFVSYIRSNNKRITDSHILTIMDDTMIKLGIHKDIPLYENALIVSPMLVCLLHPFIILPKEGIDADQLSNIFIHELTHYKRKDLWYKWLFQLVWCIHWFNPILYFVNRSLNTDCELSCDETVISHMGNEERRAYGNMILDAAEMNINYRSNVLSTTLIENKNNLKERLKNIMNYKKNTNLILVISLLSVVVILFAAAIIGVKSSDQEDMEARNTESEQSESSRYTNSDWSSYNDDSLGAIRSTGKSISGFVTNLVTGIVDGVVTDVIDNIADSVTWSYDNFTFSNNERSQKAYQVFDDDEAIAGKDVEDAWRANVYYGQGIKGFDCDLLYLNGSYSILILYAKNPVELEVESSFNAKSGKYKLVHVLPDGKVKNINTSGKASTVTLSLTKGRNVVKMVGQKVKVRSVHVAFDKMNRINYDHIFSDPDEENAYFCLENIKKGNINMSEIKMAAAYMEEEQLSLCIEELFKQNYTFSVNNLAYLVSLSDSELVGKALKDAIKAGNINLTGKMLVSIVPYLEEEDVSYLFNYVIETKQSLTDSEIASIVPYIEEDLMGDYILKWKKDMLTYNLLVEIGPYMDTDYMISCVSRYLDLGNTLSYSELEDLLPWIDDDGLDDIVSKMEAANMITHEQAISILDIWG